MKRCKIAIGVDPHIRDFSTIAVVGIDDPGRVKIFETYSAKLGFDGLYEKIVETYSRFNQPDSPVVRVAIERSPMSVMLLTKLRRETVIPAFGCQPVDSGRCDVDYAAVVIATIHVIHGRKPLNIFEKRQSEVPDNTLVCIGKDGWPVEGIKGRPIITFIRRLLHTRRIVTYKTWQQEGGCEIAFNRKRRNGG